MLSRLLASLFERDRLLGAFRLPSVMIRSSIVSTTTTVFTSSTAASAGAFTSALLLRASGSDLPSSEEKKPPFLLSAVLVGVDVDEVVVDEAEEEAAGVEVVDESGAELTSCAIVST